jgi:hypothetical protein
LIASSILLIEPCASFISLTPIYHIYAKLT